MDAISDLESLKFDDEEYYIEFNSEDLRSPKNQDPFAVISTHQNFE